MSSVFVSVTLGFFLVAISSKDITAVPIPAALPPLPTRRYLEPPSPQALENAKKFPRAWGPPPPSEFFDGNFFPPNPFMEPPRGMIETNEIPQNNYDGYFAEEDFTAEEEDPSFKDSTYTGDPSYIIEPAQLAYIDPLGNHYQQNRQYISGEVDGNLEKENDNEMESLSDETIDDYDILVNTLPQINTPPPQVLTANTKNTPKPQQRSASYEYDSGEFMVDNRPRPRGYNKQQFRPENKVKPTKEMKQIVEEPIEKKTVQRELFTRTTTVTKTTTWYIDENNEVMIEDDFDEKPTPVKGKYTKKSKTTTSGPIPWYLQDFEEVIFEEENEKRKTILEKLPSLRGLNPTSITSFTTAPNPWSTEVHEEVVFEEIKSKKDTYDLEPRIPKSHGSPLDHIVEYAPRAQDHVVEYLSNPQTILEEIEMIEMELLEELAEILEEDGEVVVEVIVADFPPFAPIPMPQVHFPYPQFQPPPMHPVMKPQTAPPQLPPSPPPPPSPQPIQPPPTSELEETKVEEDPKPFVDATYPNPTEIINGMNPNQVTTPKPITTMLPPIENNFTQYPIPVSPIQGPQGGYNLQIPTTQMPQLYASHGTPQPGPNYPGNPVQSNRRDFQLQQQAGQNQRQMAEAQKDKLMQDDQARYQQRMEAENKMKMASPGPQNKQRQMYPNPQQGMNRQQPRGRDL